MAITGAATIPIIINVRAMSLEIHCSRNLEEIRQHIREVGETEWKYDVQPSEGDSEEANSEHVEESSKVFASKQCSYSGCYHSSHE